MNDETTFTSITGFGLKVGDLFTLPPFNRTRWWQFWKRPPFVSRKPKTYRVVNVTANEIGSFEEYLAKPNRR